MGESCIETSEAPAWLSKLESRREILSKAKLGHDSGAGAPCNSCSGCPGLDLHFWRKICRACHCSKDLHDIQDDHPAWAHFQLLGMARPKKPNFTVIKIRGIADEPVKLDWVPPNTSPDMVSEYMSCLGGGLAPVAGSEGAIKRREQLRRQVPLHDIQSDLCCHALTQQEQEHHQEYISHIKNQVIGVGNIVRIGTLQKGDTVLINTEASQPVPGIKSYSLPLKLSNLGKGVKYANIPKNSSDKLLVLDNKGNVLKKSAYLPDYKASPILSRIVKDKLNFMRIESDRIKSAVEHGPIYDKLFVDLRHLNVPVDNDIYLNPIKNFRDEFNANPKFKDETTAFVEAQGGKAMSPSANILNNNENALSGQMISSTPLKGTIYAPNGEIWSWSSQVDGDSNKPINAVHATDIYPNYAANSENIDRYSQRSNELPKRNIGSNSFQNMPDAPPPIPNYNTYPGEISNRPSNESYHDGGRTFIGAPNLHGNHGNLNRYDPYNKNEANINYQLSKANVDALSDPLTESVENLNINNFDKVIEGHQASPCQRCHIPLEQGHVAIKAERAGQNATWHPKCFTCKTCDQLLVDLMYFYHKGDIYCERDLAEVLKIPRCSACDELIFSKSYTAAEGQIFHFKHFCCYKCDAPLGGQQYVLDDKSGQPLCLQCDQLNADKCHACRNDILANQQGVSWTKFHWHGPCFNCSSDKCHKSLLGGKFVVKNDMPFCNSACYQSTLN